MRAFADACDGRPQRRAARRRLLRVSADRSGVAPPRAAAGVTFLGAGGVPDFARPHRLRAGRRFRRRRAKATCDSVSREDVTELTGALESMRGLFGSDSWSQQNRQRTGLSEIRYFT